MWKKTQSYGFKSMTFFISYERSSPEMLALLPSPHMLPVFSTFRKDSKIQDLSCDWNFLSTAYTINTLSIHLVLQHACEPDPRRIEQSNEWREKQSQLYNLWSKPKPEKTDQNTCKGAYFIFNSFERNLKWQYPMCRCETIFFMRIEIHKVILHLSLPLG